MVDTVPVGIRVKIRRVIIYILLSPSSLSTGAHSIVALIVVGMVQGSGPEETGSARTHPEAPGSARFLPGDGEAGSCQVTGAEFPSYMGPGGLGRFRGG